MTIMHHLDDRGGFTCGDTETGITAYAYPTSPSATAAQHRPDSVARLMLASEARHGFPYEAEYDERNWARLRVPIVPYVDICQETAYGSTQRLSFQIRVF